ncbi:MAG: protein-tyrosine-phosphatase [Bacteroidia bacterium]|nr:protein-tyrosine-phosphatase [Bacteroidia bacterium]
MEILNQFKGKTDRITQERRALLDRFTNMLSDFERPIKVNFICTHNSRRSQLAELLFHVISRELGMEDIQSYSGGTEATAFNSRMVDALRRFGFKLVAQGLKDNPLYILQYGGDEKYFFSKVYDNAFNPDKDFIAVTVCSDAETNCPIVHGATQRFHLGYKDPKAYDGTVEESQRYDEKIIEIGTELYYVLSRLNDRKTEV